MNERDRRERLSGSGVAFSDTSGGQSFTAPPLRRIIRAMLLDDWYADTAGVAVRLMWSESPPPELSESETAVSASAIETGVLDPVTEGMGILLFDPLNTISASLIAVQHNGVFAIPTGSDVYCYQPDDAIDGHYEPLAFGTGHPEGSGSTSAPSESTTTGLLRQFRVNDVLLPPAVAKQRVVVTGSAGTYDLIYGTVVISTLAYDLSDLEAIQTSLRAIPGLEHVLVYQTAAGTVFGYEVIFAEVDDAQVLEVDGSSLTGNCLRIDPVTQTGDRWYSCRITNLATSGTYTLTHSGSTTSALAWNADAATVQTAVRALGATYTAIEVIAADNGYVIRMVGGLSAIWTSTQTLDGDRALVTVIQAATTPATAVAWTDDDTAADVYWRKGETRGILRTNGKGWATLLDDGRWYIVAGEFEMVVKGTINTDIIRSGDAGDVLFYDDPLGFNDIVLSAVNETGRYVILRDEVTLAYDPTSGWKIVTCVPTVRWGKVVGVDDQNDDHNADTYQVVPVLASDWTVLDDNLLLDIDVPVPAGGLQKPRETAIWNDDILSFTAIDLDWACLSDVYDEPIGSIRAIQLPHDGNNASLVPRGWGILEGANATSQIGRFLRGSEHGGLVVGGEDSHTHGIEADAGGGISGSGMKVADTTTEPKYIDVVWIIRTM